MQNDNDGLQQFQQQEEQQMNKLAFALVKAQASMHAASKDSRNPHFKSTYSSLAAVIDAVREPLAINGLCFVQKLHTTEGGVSVETVIIHESGEHLSCGILFVPVSKNDAQGFGSAISYGKRYSLQAALGVSSEDDDGQAASQQRKPQEVAQSVIDEMLLSKDMIALKAAFAHAYKQAPEQQKDKIKAVYEQQKAKFTPEI